MAGRARLIVSRSDTVRELFGVPADMARADFEYWYDERGVPIAVSHAAADKLHRMSNNNTHEAYLARTCRRSAIAALLIVAMVLTTLIVAASIAYAQGSAPITITTSQPGTIAVAPLDAGCTGGSTPTSGTAVVHVTLALGDTGDTCRYQVTYTSPNCQTAQAIAQPASPVGIALTLGTSCTAPTQVPTATAQPTATPTPSPPATPIPVPTAAPLPTAQPTATPPTAASPTQPPQASQPTASSTPQTPSPAQAAPTSSAAPSADTPATSSTTAPTASPTPTASLTLRTTLSIRFAG